MVFIINYDSNRRDLYNILLDNKYPLVTISIIESFIKEPIVTSVDLQKGITSVIPFSSSADFLAIIFSYNNPYLMMKSTILNPQIELCNIENKSCLRFSFNGSLVEEEAKKAIVEWKRLFKTKSGEKMTLVWDCNKMTGYDPGARIVWQNAMKELKEQISSIWVVSKSGMIRSGAMIIAMITKHDIKVVQYENEISIT